MANSHPEPINLDQNILDRLVQIDEWNPKNLPAPFPRSDDPLPRLGDPPPQHPIPHFNLSGHPEPRRASKSATPKHDQVDISHTAAHRIRCNHGDIWLSGSSLFCACPDCGAPMTIRIWLQLADCWRCRSSLALTEEQSLAARHLAQHAVSPALPSTTPVRHRPIPAAPNVAPNVAPLEDALESPEERELEALSRGSVVARLLRHGFRMTPAWMVSFLVHLIVILILALIMLQGDASLPTTITLSTFLSSDHEEGGTIRFENPLDALQDDLALANQLDLADQEVRNILQKANQDAKVLRVDHQPVAPLPHLNDVKKNITTRQDNLMSFAARDPRVRAEIVQKEGGTTITEAAVARGIRWLASVQNKNGGWSRSDYRHHNRKNNPSDVIGTSLALLPMLGAGQTHEYGAYKQNVAAGIAWLLDHQKSDGDLRAGFSGQAGMYAHGQATIVLCEALALTGDQKLHEPAAMAIRFIESAQHTQGGWRYRPGQKGDTSVFGWQMMALQSARADDLNLNVDDATLKLADYFLDQVIAPAHFQNRRKTELPDGAAYSYMPGRDATPTMTAEAILCRMYLGWEKNDPRLDSAVKWLVQDHLPSINDPNLYYWYYGTQVMHHYGGKHWETWNNRMRELLITTQKTSGTCPGSWSPSDFEWGLPGGRIYTTSLAVCTLEVYYRHLPLFKQIALDE